MENCTEIIIKPSVGEALHQAMERQSTEIVAQVRQLIIISTDDRKTAEGMVQQLKQMENYWFEYLDGERESAYRIYLRQKQRLDDRVEPLKELRKTLKSKCMIYDDEQGRLRREEQRQREKDAQIIAEKEALEMALQAEAEGDHAAAKAIIEAPIAMPTIVMQKAAVAPSRLTAGREIWSFKIVDATKIPRQYLIPDEKAIGQVVRALKDKINIPGVKAYSEKV